MRTRPQRSRIAAPTFLAALAASLVAMPAGAQETRWSVTPRVSYAWPGDVFRHEIRQDLETPSGEPVTIERLERLNLQPMSTVGASVAYRILPRWRLGVVAERGSGSFEYLEEAFYTPVQGETQPGDMRWVRSDARLAGVGAEVAWHALTRDRLDLSMTASLNVQKLVLHKDEPCPPSLGAPCYGVSGPWEREYSHMTMGTGVAASYRLTRRLGVEVGGALSTGQADTSSFWRELHPDYRELEAPRSYRLIQHRAYAGLTIHL